MSSYIVTTTLDHSGLLPLRLSYEETTQQWKAELSLLQVTRDRMVTHLLAMLEMRIGLRTASFRQKGKWLIAELAARQADDACSITLNNRALVRYRADKGTLRPLFPSWYRLTVSETRMLGQYPHPCLPYPRSDERWSQDYIALLTDLHTHLSSQITALGLLEAASEADAAYPLELLERIDIDTTGLAQVSMASVPFTPAASDGLRCEQRGQEVPAVKVRELLKHPQIAEQLAASMVIPADDTITFDTLERRVYRMRNPLAKHPGIIRSTLLHVAEGYARHGTLYAELAVTAALDPLWLEAATAAIVEAEARTGVQLRLLAALPRSLDPLQTLKQLEIVKFISRHPVIVGIDFLGYEANKTRNFGWALNNIARFAASQSKGHYHHADAWHFRDDFILRVHAGENGKNPDNVGDVLEIAARHGVRLRIGHAAYGKVADNLAVAQTLARAGKLIIEFNPDSNIAMNNIDRIEQLPIRLWADAGIPFVIASDGAGIYQTDSRQLFASSLFAGLDGQGISLLQETEETHIAWQRQLFKEKTLAFQSRYPSESLFFEQMRQHISEAQAINAFDRLQSKIPLLIAGASGSSWSRIHPSGQREIREGIFRLVRQLDPKRVCFVMGRVKNEGLGHILDEALNDYLLHYPHAPIFDVVGMLSHHQNMPTLAEHLNHIIPLHGELMSVPTQMTSLLKQHGGAALYMGGSAFTRDFIKRSEDVALPFGVMEGIEGASGEKALVLEESYLFRGADGMVNHVRHMLGDDVFRYL